MEKQLSMQEKNFTCGPIVGKDGTLWHAKATIEHDNHEECKAIAMVLLEQRNEMYETLEVLYSAFMKVDSNNGHAKLLGKLLAKARGE